MPAEPPGTRVVYVGLNYAPDTTGIAVYATRLTRGLARRGFQVTVLTGLPHYPQWRVLPGFRPEPGTPDADGVTVRRVRHYVPGNPVALKRAAMELGFGLGSVFRRWNRPQVVVVTSPALLASILALLRARLQRVPVVTWVQDIYTLGVAQTGTAGRAARMMRLLEGALVRGSTHVVTIHDRFRQYLIDQLGADPARVSVIRNWSHLAPTAHARDEQARAAHGWAPEDIIVLHAGNMGAKQGLDNVVAASRVADATGSRVRFVLLGDGNQRSRLEAAGGNPHLQFLDPLPDDDFLRTVNSADILLVNELPGLTEMSVPSKLTTYFATGLPVLGAVDTSSVTADELAASGGSVRVPAADPEALVRAAEQLASDPAAARRLGAANLAYRERLLSEDAALTAFAALLPAVVAATSRH